jgi:hypothetical protein
MAATYQIREVLAEIEHLSDGMNFGDLSQTLSVVRGYLQGQYKKDAVFAAINRQKDVLNEDGSDEALEIWNYLDHMQYVIEDEAFLNNILRVVEE